MTLLQHFDTLVETDPALLATDPASADLATWLAQLPPARQAELAQLLLRHARALSRRWQPRRMHEWLT